MKVSETLYEKGNLRVRYNNLDGYLYVEKKADSGVWYQKGMKHISQVANDITKEAREEANQAHQEAIKQDSLTKGVINGNN